jgi:Icc-related predicted phosphoesterase
MMKTGLRILCFSDTHGMHERIKHLPQADIIVHAGDFTNVGEKDQILSFVNFLTQTQPQAQKLFIAGNHDMSLHTDYFTSYATKRYFNPIAEPKNYSLECRNIVYSAHPSVRYMEDSAVDMEFGYLNENNEQATYKLKSYGSPWQPKYAMGFNLQRGEQLLEKWSNIPLDTDILVTHGPPHGVLDKNFFYEHCGCEELTKVVKNFVKPRLHVFGHIHEDYGFFLFLF